MQPRHALTTLAIAACLPFTAYDEPPQGPPDPATTKSIVIEGQQLDRLNNIRVTMESDTFLPIPHAQVLLEAAANDEGAPFFEIEPITVTTDDAGFFSIPDLPPQIERVSAHVFFDGVYAGTREIALEQGAPVQKSITLLAVTNWITYVGIMWASARKAASKNDKYGHCVASCRTSRWCGGPFSAFTAGLLKETLDFICSLTGENSWLRNLVAGASACQGWDWQDVAANNRGIWCSGRILRSCERCCSSYY